jgi:hypothetical protein
MYGSGLNELTVFGSELTCLVFNSEGEMIQKAPAFSVSDAELTCHDVSQYAS